jgi:hypothetical protein
LNAIFGDTVVVHFTDATDEQKERLRHVAVEGGDADTAQAANGEKTAEAVQTEQAQTAV